MLTTQQRSRFIQECLERTNEHRCKHGVSALKLNQKLSSISQAWAEHLLRSNCLSHNPRAQYSDTDLGENVAYNYKSSEEVRGSEMIDQWYNEIIDYNFNTHSSHKTTGHFTQLVWKNSKEVGFGLAASNGRHYLVSNYFPPGNYVGQYKENVFPAQDGRSRTIFGGSNKTSQPTQASFPQKIPQKQQNFQELSWTFKIGDDNFRPETRDPPKGETWNVQDRPRDGARKYQLQEPPAGGNLLRKHDGEKSIIGNLTSRLSAKFGLQNNDKKQESKHVTTAGSRKPSSTIIVTETFRDEPGSYTSTRSYVTKTTDHGGVDFGKRIVHTTVQNGAREMEPVQTTDRAPRFSIEASEAAKIQQNHQQFEDEVLSGHNKYRARHQAASLIMNPQISRLAQNWADRMARSGELKFSGNEHLGQQLGESVALKYSSVPVDYRGSELVENWYKEKDDYNFNSSGDRTNLDKIGHFTQMVWRGSREIGIGKAWSQDWKRVFVVCNYLPAGNVLGSFKENVVA